MNKELEKKLNLTFGKGRWVLNGEEVIIDGMNHHDSVDFETNKIYDQLGTDYDLYDVIEDATMEFVAEITELHDSFYQKLEELGLTDDQLAHFVENAKARLYGF